ncbi:hypothetical protein AALA69_05245 [Eggerthellaceae bacterium 24-137]
MRRNKEIALIEDSLGHIAKVGTVLRIVFTAASVLFALLLVAGLLGIGSALAEGVSVAEWMALASVLIQDLVMLYAFAICALVARDSSRGITPFSRKQVSRTLSVGWVMLGYTLFCLVLDPLAAQVQYAAGVAAVSLFGSPQPGELFINFETLIAAGAFFLFSYILSYGKTLQELADETA